MSNSTSAKSGAFELNKFEQLRTAKEIIATEAKALTQLSGNLPADFYDAVQMICGTQGAVIVTGMGKAGWIGQKVSASMASTGTRSHFLHPGEAFHGDLGRIGPDDIVLAFSNSGETSEITQILPSLAKRKTPLIAVTSKPHSTLAKFANLILDYTPTAEAGHLGLAPSTSTTIMLALGDALTLVASHQKKFRDVDFAKYHPGGSLGRRLTLVDEIMRPLESCRIAYDSETIRNIYVQYNGPDRRVGVILLTDDSGRLTGLFTDSDLARMLERGQENMFDQRISELMTLEPVTVFQGSKTSVAVETLSVHNLSELPVIDGAGRPVGLIDITDVLGLVPSKKEK